MYKIIDYSIFMNITATYLDGSTFPFQNDVGNFETIEILWMYCKNREPKQCHNDTRIGFTVNVNFILASPNLIGHVSKFI